MFSSFIFCTENKRFSTPHSCIKQLLCISKDLRDFSFFNADNIHILRQISVFHCTGCIYLLFLQKYVIHLHLKLIVLNFNFYRHHDVTKNNYCSKSNQLIKNISNKWHISIHNKILSYCSFHWLNFFFSRLIVLCSL